MGIYDRQSQTYPGLNRRARRQARRSTGPQRRDASRQISRIRRQTGRETGRIQNQAQRATRTARRNTGRQAEYERSLAQNLHGLGGDADMVRRQLLKGAGQVTRYGAGLAMTAQRASELDTHAVNRSAKDSIASIEDQVRNVVQQTASTNLQDLVAQHRAKQREAAQAAKADTAEAVVSGVQDSAKAVNDATGDIASLINHPPAYLTALGVKPGDPPRTNQDWAIFRAHFQQEHPGMPPALVNQAIAAFRAQRTSASAQNALLQTALSGRR